MPRQLLTRRQALGLAAAGAALTSLTGCPIGGGSTGALSAAAAKTVIRVSWQAIKEVLKIVVRGGKAFITAILATGAEQTVEVALDARQQEALNRGSQVVVETEDGKQHTADKVEIKK